MHTYHSLAETVGLDHVKPASELLDVDGPLTEPDLPAPASPGKPPATPLEGHNVTGEDDDDMFDIDEMVESKSRLYFCNNI